MSNFLTEWITGTKFRPALMNAPLIEIDKMLGYLKDIIVKSSAAPSWNPSTGYLTWASDIHIYFVASTGATIRNIISASNLSIPAGQSAVVDLVETTDQVITMSAASIAGAGTTQKTIGKIILATRSATGNILYPGLMAGFETVVAPSYSIITPTVGATTSVDISGGEQAGKVTIDQDTTINFTGAVGDMAPFTLHVTFDATGGWVITWGTMVEWSTALTEPTITNTANAEFYIAFRYDSTAAKYRVMAVLQGF